MFTEVQALKMRMEERQEEYNQVCASLGEDLKQLEEQLRNESQARQVLEQDKRKFSLELLQAQKVLNTPSSSLSLILSGSVPLQEIAKLEKELDTARNEHDSPGPASAHTPDSLDPMLRYV